MLAPSCSSSFVVLTDGNRIAVMWRGRTRLAHLVVGAGVGAVGRTMTAACADPAPSTPADHGESATQQPSPEFDPQKHAEAMRPPALSMRELCEGDGPTARTGAWVTCHYIVRLVGDGTVIEDTRTSGLGDRDYGQPCQFELGNLSEGVVGALHAGVLDMRVGGRRRIRTCLMEPDFGYAKASAPGPVQLSQPAARPAARSRLHLSQLAPTSADGWR